MLSQSSLTVVTNCHSALGMCYSTDAKLRLKVAMNKLLPFCSLLRNEMLLKFMLLSVLKSQSEQRKMK